MTKTYNISCEIKLFEDFRALINGRGNKISTVLQEYMRTELNKADIEHASLESRIEALEEAITNLINEREKKHNEA